MYSHELQTCDWPRNVGCGEANGIEGGASGPGGVNTNRVTETRGPPPQLQRGREPQQQSLPRDQQHPPQQVAKFIRNESILKNIQEEGTSDVEKILISP
ncbi:unnamed protein product [Bemisia tabaci]|uniref:Uncharacterized protein n=1 Tax=Bemisia tabaci TaxID=7038 RepID=A0A9P0AHJ9_BEMTA|nr:unnamed protein product [Bemisia tabaci]